MSREPDPGPAGGGWSPRRYDGPCAQFTPHRFDADRGGEEWGAELREIETVGKMPRTWNRYDGGLRVRLELTMRDGHSELFVVPKVDRVIAQIGPLVEAARGRRF